MRECVVSGISHRFRRLSRSEGQITHVLLTRSPLVYSRRSLTARLACVKHAASVRPEPGSNSPLKSVDHAGRDPRVELNGVSRQERLVDPEIDSTLSYQRNRRLSVGGIAAPEPVVDGALLIRSSTFSTLLSSQGSCAHPDRASRLTWGQPNQTYRSRAGASNRRTRVRAHHRTWSNGAKHAPKDADFEGGAPAAPAARHSVGVVLRPVALSRAS
jgi:hypothetical protein